MCANKTLSTTQWERSKHKIGIFLLGNTEFIYYKKKKKIAPQPPAIIPEDCSAENNSVTVAWQAPNHSFVEGYVLELDDGSGGEFRVSTGI